MNDEEIEKVLGDINEASEVDEQETELEMGEDEGFSFTDDFLEGKHKDDEVVSGMKPELEKVLQKTDEGRTL